MEETLFHRIECMLFVAGDPVPVTELSRVLELSTPDMIHLLGEMEAQYAEQGRGVRIMVTNESAQLISSRDYLGDVEKLFQPEAKKSVSQSLMETLAVIAYRQPVTRADIEAVRGVRCDYAVTQLQKMELIIDKGRKDVPGRPVLFGTTDQFLHKFGIHSIEELPEYLRFSVEARPTEEEIPAV